MNIKINHQPEAFQEKSLTLEQLLAKKNLLHKKGIAIAVNDEVIPASKWSHVQIKENDEILIVTATQGG